MIYTMNDELAAQILTNMLDNTDKKVDTREGTPTYTLQAPNADEFANAYAEFQAVKDETFIINDAGEVVMTGARLDAWVRIFGMERKPGGHAVGNVTLSAAEPTLVPAGTQVFAPATLNVLFATDIDVIATLEGVSVPVTAVYEGEDGNVSSNAVTGVVGDLAGVITVTNPTATTGGFDEESDEELATRYMNYMRRPASSGNANDYYKWATSVAGISDALIIPVWNGAGTVKAVILSVEHRAPTEEKVQEVADYIEENRPIDANNITVEAAGEIPINVIATVTHTGDLAEIKADYELQLSEHFKGLDFTNGDYVRVTRLQNLLLDTIGVEDFSDFTVNDGTSNISIPAGSIAVVGAITLNEVV